VIFTNRGCGNKIPEIEMLCQCEQHPERCWKLMYNLLVANKSEDWDGETSLLDLDRCISDREYTDTKITEMYGDLSPTQIDQIIQFPCIFAYETQCHKDPKFGFIHKVVKRQGQRLVKIHYEIIHLDKFLTQSDLEEMHIELDIHGWEYSRTHWAIKDVNLTEELNAKGMVGMGMVGMVVPFV
jgi:hypothetical protein